IRWIPSFGYERELDWLLNMHDWMISKKRYWGLALPIYDCEACGIFDVVGGRDELRQRAVEGWQRFEGHTPHRPYVDEVKIACRSCGKPVSRIADVGNPWLDAGIVPFSTLHYREEPEYWRQWFPADFISESLPGQFRNWFYSMLAMSTVLRREPPFRTIFGYMTLFAEDGRPMHKSSGNSIEFNDAAERIGADVMRWTYAKARPEDNLLFGYHATDEARRELLVLWNVFVFFVTYARLAGWRPGPGAAGTGAGASNVLDRWIASRTAALAASVRADLDDFDTRAASQAISTHIDELSQWYLRRGRRRFSRNGDPADRDAAFVALHGALVGLTRILAPILPFLAERMYGVLVGSLEGEDASVHLTAWPDEELAPSREGSLERAMTSVVRAVELVRTLRSQSGLKVRQPLGTLWLALPGGMLAVGISPEDTEAMLALIADETNVRRVELIGDESELVERRVKPLLPKIGKRLGSAIPAIMVAARAGDVEFLPGGGVRLAGVELAADEVEILATPRPGTAVAHDEGIVVVIDTVIDDDLRAEGDARELSRAIQDLRKQAELALDDRIEVWVAGPAEAREALSPHLAKIAADTLAVQIHTSDALPDGDAGAELALSGGLVRVTLRRCRPPAASASAGAEP
ncbi:MAG: class I tRNA ligase family protein, partial [Chloroflexi bacterium]|nr:class I tRNA ligase family protein [Chloroflexota bacterium]